MRYLLVGEAPNSRGQRRGLDVYLVAKALGRVQDLHASPARFLGSLVRVHPELWAFLRRTRHLNLVDEFPGRQGKGAAFPMATMRTAAVDVARFASKLDKRTQVLLAGKRVAQAFGSQRDYFNWFMVGRCMGTAIPHPSGVNRWWNEPGNRTMMLSFLEHLGAKP